MKSVEIKITTEYIKLDSLLKFSGLAETGSDAKEIIKDGRIMVGDEVCLMRGKKIRSGDKVYVPEIDTELVIK